MKARLAGLLALLALIGCGGGGGGTSGTPTPTTASLNLTIVWPTRGRIVPVAAETVRTTVRASASLPISGELVLTRPASSGKITGIPTGPQLVTSEALDASGKVVAARTVQMTFTGGDAPGISIDMDSSVETLAVAPASPTVNVGASVTLSANATNDRGDGVLLTPSKLSWSVISGASFASINTATGLVTGLAAGTTVVQVLDSESKRTGNATVNVTSSLPGTANLDLRVVWPSRGRIIPGASETIRTQIRASLSQPVTGQLVLTRPTETGRITGIPVDSPQFVISEALDANGKVVGSRSVQMSFSAGSSPSLTLDLDSTVESVSLTSPSPSLQVGSSMTLSASAVNSNGDAVLLTPSKLEWSIVAGQSLASLSSSGSLSGLQAGQVTVRVRDTESGKDATATVSVIAVSGMEDLGAGDSSRANSISSDGSTIVGLTGPTQQMAFRWTKAGGLQTLGNLGQGYSTASDCSLDGSVVAVIVGVMGSYRWTSATGLVSIGYPTFGSPASAMGVSGDGKVIVGFTGQSNNLPFRWTSTTGFVMLGTDVNGRANDISSDGSTVVGGTTDGDGRRVAFRWTQAGGMQTLGFLPGGLVSEAQAVSADGSVVVGTAWNASGFVRAFRWTQAGGMQDLGTLGGGNQTAIAWGVSADGSVVVGESENPGFFTRAFRWTASSGMKDLGTLGGNTSAALDISADGKVVVGRSAAVSSGPERAFRLQVP